MVYFSLLGKLYCTCGFILQESLVDSVVRYPLAAATMLRNHGLVESFRAILGVQSTSTAHGDHLPAEMETEDKSQAYIIGMPHHPVVDSAHAPKWCKCGRCRMVKNSAARICCRNTSGPCVILTDDELRVTILGSRVVRTGLNQARRLHFQSTWNHAADNLRHQAYQQYIYATIGTTGRHHRVPVPACICWAIRDRWPSLAYKGYKEAGVNGVEHVAYCGIPEPNSDPNSNSEEED